MDNKLTCKLSDGREYEVVQECPPAEGSSLIVVWLRSFKREPREYDENNYRDHPLWKFLQACRVHLMQIKDREGRPIFELWGSAHDARDWLKDEIIAGRIK